MIGYESKIIVQKGHFTTVQKVAYCPGEDILVTAPFQGALRFWEKGGICIGIIPNIGPPLSEFFWHPDGDRFAVAAGEKIKIRSVSGKESTVFEHPELIVTAAFSPDGDRVITILNNALYIWNINGDLLHSLFFDYATFSCLSIHPDGHLLAGTFESGIKIFDERGILVKDIEDPGKPVKCAEFAGTGEIVIGSDMGVFAAIDRKSDFKQIAETDGEVTCLSISPDGTRIAGGLYDGSLHVWDMSGKEVVPLPKQQDWVFDVAWNQDGTEIAVCSNGSPVTVFNSSGEPRYVIDGDRSRFHAARFDSMNGLVPICSQDDVYDIFDLDPGTREFLNKRTALIGGGGTVDVIDFFPAGELLAAVDSRIQIMDREGDISFTFTGHEEHVNCAAVSPSGEYVVSGSADATVMIWEKDGEIIHRFRTGEDPPGSMAWHPDGKIFAIGDAIGGNPIRLYNNSGDLIQEIPVGDTEYGINGLCFSGDGSRVIAWSGGGWVRSWTLEGELMETLQDPENLSITVLAFDPDDNIVTGNSHGRIHTWEKGRVALTIKPKNDETYAVIDSLAVSSSGILVTGESRDERNFIYIRTNDGKRVTRIQMPTGMFVPLLALNEVNDLICCAAGNWIYFYTMDGEPSGELKLSPGRIGGLDILASSDRVRIAAGYEDGTVELMDIDGDVLFQDRVHEASVDCVAFSPREDRLVSGSSDGTITLLSLDGVVEREITASAGVLFLVFNSDGDQFLASTADGNLHLWNIAGEQLIAVQGDSMKGELDLASFLSFNPQGSTFAAGFTGYDRGYVCIYSNSGELIQTIEGFSNSLGQLLLYHSSGEYIAFTNIDFEILVYRIPDRELVCTVVPIRDGFIAYTPDGRFDCSSPEVEGSVGIVSGSNVELFSEKHSSLRTPGLLVELFKM